MSGMGLAGAVRGKPVKTTVSEPGQSCPQDRVRRDFAARRPNQLWVADFAYVATWRGFVYVAFVVDAFTRRIVRWRMSSTLRPTWSWTHWSRPCTSEGRTVTG